MGSVGGPELLFLTMGLMAFVAAVWTAIDAGSRPDWAWERTGQSKIVWIVAPLVGAFICSPVGAVLAIVYFGSIRQRVIEAQNTY